MMKEMHPIANEEWMPLDLWARLFPYIALAAWHDDGATINDTLHQLHGPDMQFHPVHTEKDFAYHFEIPGKFQVIVVLGTHTKEADRGNKSPFPVMANGGFHDDFLDSGSELFHWLKGHIETDSQIFITGHSRGDPLALVVGKCLTESGFCPVTVRGYCGPPSCTNEGIEYLDTLDGLKCEHLIMPGDVVDNLGKPILHHWGEIFNTPDIGSYRDYPIVGNFFGHAYSSIYNVLGDWYEAQKKMNEVWWLRQCHWFCKI
jgi:hypothetical protein